MSNLPSIYSNCKAGCLWETVHKSDFLKSASIVKLAKANATSWIVDIDNVYKIVSASTNNAYNCAVSFRYVENGGQKDYAIAISEFDAYRDYVHFEMLSATTNGSTLTLVYEINGNRYTETISGTAIDLTTCKLVISNAIEVFVYNVNATITGAPALTFNETIDFDIEPVKGASYSAEYKYFNRTPEVGETFIFPARYGEETYEIQCKVTALRQYVDYEIINVLYTRGAYGGGTTLRLYTVTLNTGVREDVTKLINIVNRAKGSYQIKHDDYMWYVVETLVKSGSITLGRISSRGQYGFIQYIMELLSGGTPRNSYTEVITNGGGGIFGVEDNEARTLVVTYYNDAEIDGNYNP